MSLHDEIVIEIRRCADDVRTVDTISPTTIAIEVTRKFGIDVVEPHMRYAALEHVKAMVRKELARRAPDPSEPSTFLDPDGVDLLGDTQKYRDRYPLPHARGEEPQWQLTENIPSPIKRIIAASYLKLSRSLAREAHALEALADAQDANPGGVLDA